jgi:cytochrome oxidase Cu insertion factor (SCO1/SenC/PrrC family)
MLPFWHAGFAGSFFEKRLLRYVTHVSIIAALAITASLTASAAEPPKVGQRAPDFTLVDQNGKKVSLSAARGHKVVLVFYRGYW